MNEESGLSTLGIGWLITGYLRGLQFLFIAPRWALRFVLERERFVWPVYPAFLWITVSYGYLIHYLRYRDGESLVFFMAMPLLSGLMLMLADLMQLWGGIFAWHPGRGIRDRDGNFRPLFRFGPTYEATTGGAVLRGSVVVDGKDRAWLRRRPIEMAIHIGKVAIPRATETEHFLISGKTGSGKTQAIEAMLRTVRARGEPALIADPAGGYYSRFGRDGDILLNPFDRRSEAWSPFAEIEQDYDCERIAQATIPPADGDSREWHFYAQSLLAETLRALHGQGSHSVRELLRMVMSADRDELGTLLADTPAAVLCHKGNDKMLSNTRSITALHLNAWTYLQDEGKFSLRQWVRNHQGAWAYLIYRDDQVALLRLWVSTLLDIAIVEGLSLPDTPDARLWYVLDELDSLGPIASLQAGVTKLRKHGGAVIAGLQTIAQLRATYGEHTAQTLLSCLSTKLILAAGDSETAQYFEKELGEQEIERIEHTETDSFTGIFTGEVTRGNSSRPDRKIQATVLASEILSLQPLRGYLRPVGAPIRTVALPYVSMSARQAAFETYPATPAPAPPPPVSLPCPPAAAANPSD